ncbi:hypothetical protein ASZ90_009928 [hydrocarbon metagenome]|uniref:Uncharacterized protein n=1 Tax=hydrocarbon metagenome TaxID=938273 RepID=A0A0W8FHH5_9ZZZZ
MRERVRPVSAIGKTTAYGAAGPECSRERMPVCPMERRAAA